MTLCISTERIINMIEPNDYLNFRAAEEKDHDTVVSVMDQYLYEVEIYGEEW